MRFHPPVFISVFNLYVKKQSGKARNLKKKMTCCENIFTLAEVERLVYR